MSEISALERKKEEIRNTPATIPNSTELAEAKKYLQINDLPMALVGLFDPEQD
jgi:hypothetical protein